MNAFVGKPLHEFKFYTDPGRITFGVGENIKFLISLFSDLPVSSFQFRLWTSFGDTRSQYDWKVFHPFSAWPLPPLVFSHVGRWSLQLDTAELLGDTANPATLQAHWLGDFSVWESLTRLPSLLRDSSGVLWTMGTQRQQMDFLHRLHDLFATLLLRKMGVEAQCLSLKEEGNAFKGPNFRAEFDAASQRVTLLPHGLSISLKNYEAYIRPIREFASVTRELNHQSAFSMLAMGSVHYGYNLSNFNSGAMSALVDHNMTCNTGSMVLHSLISFVDRQARFVSMVHPGGAHAFIVSRFARTPVIFDPSEGVSYSGSIEENTKPNFDPPVIILPRFNGFGLNVRKLLQQGATTSVAASLVPDTVMALAVFE